MTPPRPPESARPVDLDDLIARTRSALPPPAPPPFAERDGPHRRREGAPRSPPAPAAALLALDPGPEVGGGGRDPPRRRRRGCALDAGPGCVGATVRRRGSSRWPSPPEIRVLRAGRPVEPAGEGLLARAGDELVADGAATLRFGDRTAIEVEPRARLRLRALDAVEMVDGRATFDVRHDEARAFRVATASVSVIDRGTRFAVEVSADPAGERVLVTVEQGEVAVLPDESRRGGRRHGRSSRGRASPSWPGSRRGRRSPSGARPLLSLEAEDVAPARDDPVIVRLVFDNPTDGWLALPAYDPVRAPLHVEVRAPDGSVQAVRVSEAMLVGGGGSGRSLPPRGTPGPPGPFRAHVRLPGDVPSACDLPSGGRGRRGRLPRTRAAGAVTGRTDAHHPRRHLAPRPPGPPPRPDPGDLAAGRARTARAVGGGPPHGLLPRGLAARPAPSACAASCGSASSTDRRSWASFPWIGAALVAGVGFLATWRRDLGVAGIFAFLLGGIAGVLAWVVARHLVRPMRRRLSDETLALSVEERHRRLNDRLAASLDFDRELGAPSRGESAQMMTRVVEEAEAEARALSFAHVASARRALGRVGLGAAAAAVARGAAPRHAGDGRPLGAALAPPRGGPVAPADRRSSPSCAARAGANGWPIPPSRSSRPWASR